MTLSPASMLNVQTLVCSMDFRTNCYVVHPRSPAHAPAWIIDPGFGADRVVQSLERDGLQPAAILLTHGHLDHIGGVPEILDRWPGTPICISRAEADAFTSPQANLSQQFGLPMSLPVEPTRLLDDGDRLTLGELEFQCIIIRGHSPGGVCFYSPASGDLFSGDVVFAQSIGRDDLPGGDLHALLTGIRERLFTLPDATRVWSGHGPVTTIGVRRRLGL